MPPFRKSRETEQNATQAIHGMETLTQEVLSLQRDFAHTRHLLEGLWELFKQETGKSEDELAEIVTKLEEQKASAPREAEKCPSCGRALQERSKACIYCGTPINKRRLF